MQIIPEPIEFEWDKGNQDKNYKKHNVCIKEAEEVFFNQPNFAIEDPGHSDTEERFQIFGVTNKKRKLTIIYALRKNKIRVISARDMNKKERRFYEEKAKTNS